jgi:hypothetical protein
MFAANLSNAEHPSLSSTTICKSGEKNLFDKVLASVAEQHHFDADPARKNNAAAAPAAAEKMARLFSTPVSNTTPQHLS